VTDHVVEVPPARPSADRLTVVDSSLGSHLFGLGELPAYRELLLLLAWRDVKVRYKQTLIGVGWAVIQPLLTMVVFTIVFSRVAHVSSGGRPYAVLVFVGLLPWQLFSQAVTRTTTSLVSNNSLISKIYFPRVIIPVAAIGSPLFDFVISLGILAILMGAYGVAPGWGLVALPFFVALTLLASLAAGLWMSALNARFRDIGYAIPFVLQIGLYLTPVAYPLSAVPAKWRTFFELNPMTEFVQGFRWGLIGESPPNWALLGAGTAVVLAFLGWGLSYFARTEQTLADVI
jgi:lipopolysaccharide transport system permease protein